MKKANLITLGLLLGIVGLIWWFFREEPVKYEPYVEPTPDIEVSTQKEKLPLFGVQPVLRIQMIEDNVEIKQVIVNRGGCEFTPKLSQQGKTSFYFGETLEGAVVGCNIKEVTVTTDRGTFSFTFR